MKEYTLEVTTITKTRRTVKADDIHRAIVQVETNEEDGMREILESTGINLISIKAKAVKKSTNTED